MRRLFLLALLPALHCRPAQPPVPADALPPLRFALIGDQQYDEAHEQAFERMAPLLAAEPLSFVLHVGDFQGGGVPCTDSLAEARRAAFDRSPQPFVLLFGDNEWTDCHRTGGDPLLRLARLRALFTAGDESLGRTRLRLERQSATPAHAAYRENVRWEAAGVLFVGLHAVGSNNNLGRTPEMDAEYLARSAAALAWLDDSFRLARARRLRGVLLALHANPFLDAGPTSGFTALLDALRAEIPAFDGPVVLVHGDTHRCRIDHPFADPRTGAPLARFTRVEVFGFPYAHWIRGEVRRGDPALFHFEPVQVPGNVPAECER